ncbi:thioredoxin-dependent thiol peroxidase [Candidatus Woesearchaeota archaeon]|uniref:thioredoxin-dependent peroxiredoxin n=1 Tax=candidate division CPR2 bacterium GW2011_GWC2_39_10 TaxID=1618345 RepID=A0A0G0LZF4_UNCC2|nr:MAG: Peroxiredoxin [candidate division CPR2 bacterium GW2011_GWC2_39_10]MBS3141631.1 thioredoxin-dependent thiol peroxidase [Candidatus Woesearchaeota archaeon]
MKINDNAFDFELKDADGNLIKLSDYKDKTVILYFYPKDNTPGCTKEACNIRDNLSSLKKKGLIIFGISLDNDESHKKFTEKYNLNFPLLSDNDKKVSKAYGIYVKKNMYGKEYYGIKRTTFIIEKMKIKNIIEKVDVENHAKQILELL